MVGGAAVVVHDEPGRVDARPASDEGAGAPLSERFGGELVADDRHDPGLDSRLEAAEVGVAREDDVLRLHAPPCGGHLGRTSPPDPLDARVFEDPGPGTVRGGGHPAHEAQGVQVSAPRIHPPPDVAVARDFLLHLRPGQHPVSAIAEAPAAEFRLGLDPSQVALARGREQIARPPVAFDAVTGDAVRDDRLRFLAERPRGLGARRAERVRSSSSIDSRRPLPTCPPLRPLAPHPTRFASSTMTEYPRSARCRAAETPVNPAPTTHTSAASRPASAGRRSSPGAVAA